MEKHLLDVLKIPKELVDELITWSDMQSLLERIDPVQPEVLLKASFVRKAFEVVLSLYRWYRNASSLRTVLCNNGLLPTSVPSVACNRREEASPMIYDAQDLYEEGKDDLISNLSTDRNSAPTNHINNSALNIEPDGEEELNYEDAMENLVSEYFFPSEYYNEPLFSDDDEENVCYPSMLPKSDSPTVTSNKYYYGNY